MRLTYFPAVALAACATQGKAPWPQLAGVPSSTTAATPTATSGEGSDDALADCADPVQVSPGEGGLEFPNQIQAVGIPSNDEPEEVTFSWPVPMTAINSLYGARRDPLTGAKRFHSGLDLAGEYGTLVRASADGYVVASGRAFGHGRQVTLAHAGGFQTSYSHLAQTLVVAGTYVRAGQPIGQLGNSGRSTGPHLHFEIQRFGETLDPLPIVGQPISVGE